MNRGGNVMESVTSLVESPFLKILSFIILLVIILVGIIGWAQLSCIPSNWEIPTITMLAILMLVIKIVKNNYKTKMSVDIPGV